MASAGMQNYCAGGLKVGCAGHGWLVTGMLNTLQLGVSNTLCLHICIHAAGVTVLSSKLTKCAALVGLLPHCRHADWHCR